MWASVSPAMPGCAVDNGSRRAECETEEGHDPLPRKQMVVR